MSHLDYDPLYINGLYDGGSYQQSMQQLLDSLATEGCCISKPNTFQNTFQMGKDYRYLSDIIKFFGDLGVRSLTATQEYGCVPILAIEEGFEYPESLINGFTREVTEKYDDLVEKSFLAYGINRESIIAEEEKNDK